MDVNKAETIPTVGDPPRRRQERQGGKHPREQTDEQAGDEGHAPRAADAVDIGGLPADGLGPEAERIINALAAQIEPMRLEAEQAKAQAERYHELATRHPILPVPNRREFEREVQHVIDHLDALGPSAALLIVHVAAADRLRATLGRQAADALMVQAAQTVTEAVHPTDTVGSLCGFDLGVVLLNGDAEAVALKTDSLRQRFGARPFTWHGRTYPMEAAFGAAVLQTGWSAEQAIAAADRHLMSVAGR